MRKIKKINIKPKIYSIQASFFNSCEIKDKILNFFYFKNKKWWTTENFSKKSDHDIQEDNQPEDYIG